MICPDCLKDKKEVKMKCIDSRPEGPKERYRRYKCPECGCQCYSKERIDE